MILSNDAICHMVAEPSIAHVWGRVALATQQWIQRTFLWPTELRTMFVLFAWTSLTAQSLAVGRNVEGSVRHNKQRDPNCWCVNRGSLCQPFSMPSCQGSLERSALEPQTGKLGSSCSMPTLVHESRREETHEGSCRGSHRRRSVQCSLAARRSSTEHLTLL